MCKRNCNTWSRYKADSFRNIWQSYETPKYSLLQCFYINRSFSSTKGIMSEAKSLEKDNLRMLKDEFYCDVTFVVGGDEVKQVIRAHKLILASRSKVFSAMFYGALKEDGEDIKLPDTDGEVMQNFLE